MSIKKESDIFKMPIKDIPEEPMISDQLRYQRITYGPKSYRRIMARGDEPEVKEYLVEVDDPLEGLLSIAQYKAEADKLEGEDFTFEVLVLTGEGRQHFEEIKKSNPNASLHLYPGMSMATLGLCFYPSVVIPKEQVDGGK